LLYDATLCFNNTKLRFKNMKRCYLYTEFNLKKPNLGCFDTFFSLPIRGAVSYTAVREKQK